jgi:hypothetical protein
MFFEMPHGCSSSVKDCGQMSGNPVRIGDGCATVTGYELPRTLQGVRRMPLGYAKPVGTWEGGSEVGARSQDIGLVVLVRSAPSEGGRLNNFSDKEKDEASPPEPISDGFDECLHSPICRSLKAFFMAERMPPSGKCQSGPQTPRLHLLQTSHWSRESKPVPPGNLGGRNERSVP